MTTSSKLHREHGLEEREIALLRYLAKHPGSTPSDISKNLAYPRTTIHFCLKKLTQRNLCIVKKTKNLSLWNLTAHGAQLLARSQTTVSQLSLSQGVSAIDETLTALASQVHTSRVYMFEPSEQTRLFTEHINEKAYARISDLIIKHDIVVEAIVGEKSLEYASKISAEVRRHMHGRPTIVYELSDELLNFKQIIICFSEDVYLLNYQSLMMTHIKNKEITENYRSVFEFYRSFAKRINFNEAIKV